jgi:hypothetical protein
MCVLRFSQLRLNIPVLGMWCHVAWQTVCVLSHPTQQYCSWMYICCFSYFTGSVGYEVAQLIEALYHKSEGHGFDSRLCHWNFSLT